MKTKLRVLAWPESEIYCVRQGPVGPDPGWFQALARWCRSGDSRDHTLLMDQKDIQKAIQEPRFMLRGVLQQPCGICGDRLAFRKLL